MILGLFADPHINVFRKSNSFLKYVDSAFKEFKEICERNKVEKIIGCGDIFHTKSYVATDALIFANKLIHDLSNIAPVVLFAGNHDMVRYYDGSVNLLDNYKYFDNVRVIEKEYEYGIFDNAVLHYVPFNPDESSMLHTIQNIELIDGRKNILFSHCGIRGFHYYTTNSYDIEDQESSATNLDFQKFDQVFLGHYHGHQSKGNIAYISSPFQSRFGDEHSQHGFIIFDTQTMTYRFYPTQSTPHFTTLEFTKENIKNLIQLENRFIRLIVRKHFSREALSVIKTKLLEKNEDVEYKFEIPMAAMNLATFEGFDNLKYTTTEDLLSGYVNHIKESIDHDLEQLLNIILG